MTPADLIQEFQSLCHDDRMRRLVELGRRVRPPALDGDVLRLLNALERGSFDERLWALQACYGSGDVGPALRALTDVSRTLRGRALNLVNLLADDVQVVEAVAALRGKTRLVLLRKLRCRDRLVPIDESLDALARSDDPALPAMLPFGSEGCVRRHFERGRSDAVFWVRLARFHPDLVVDGLLARWKPLQTADPRILRQTNSVLPRLARLRPDQALGLVRSAARLVPLGQILLQPVAERRPVEVAAMLLASQDLVYVRLDRVVAKLSVKQVLALERQRPQCLGSRVEWFSRLETADRGRVFPACGRAWRAADGRHDHHFLALLPRRLREQEAQRHLKLAVLATEPLERIPYAALLSWTQAQAVLDPFLGHPEPDYRVAAWTALTFAARFHRERLGELLGMVRERRNEQDPIRAAFLAGLSALQPGRWRVEHLDDLGQILRDALDAADLSSTSASWAKMLVVKLLPFHTDWAATWMETLARERGAINLAYLGQRLTEADVRRMAPVLTPLLEVWRKRERGEPLFALADSLGRRLTAFPALRDLIVTILTRTRQSWSAARGLALLARWDRARLWALIPELIARDPSWVTQPIVYEHLHRRRQDLLTPFLGQRAYRGRFSTGKTRFVLPFTRGFFRWTAAQRATFTKSLQQITNRRDIFRDTPTILWAVRTMAEVPDVPRQRLLSLGVKARPAVRDMALRALARLDAGEGVPTLLEALEDDRARIAIYALRPALLALPHERALEHLDAVKTRKVTVLKEVVRLLGELPSDAAFQKLQEFADRKLHRDVRVALLRALWGHLERPEAWALLETAATTTDPALLTNAVRIPTDRLSEQAQGRLIQFLAKLLEHPEPEVRAQVLRRFVELPLADADQLLLPRMVALMGSRLPGERGSALQAVLSSCTPGDVALIADGFRNLLDKRQALAEMIAGLLQAVNRDRRRLSAVATAVLEVLRTDPLAAGLTVRVALQTLPWAELPAFLVRMARAGELFADALVAAVGALAAPSHQRDVGELEQLETALAQSPDERLRRLAVAALAGAARIPPGWSDDRWERLRLYRADRSPLVAAAAQWLLPPDEDAADH